MSSEETAAQILGAARTSLLSDGYASMTTRMVADTAGVPLSQIHYHFGSKDEMILQLLATENDRLLERQAEMFGRDLPLSRRWDIACDYLDEDLESGYVRVLHEMMAAGWSSDRIGKEVAEMLRGWSAVLRQLANEASASGVGIGHLAAEEMAALTSAVFLGAESMILLGLEDESIPLRKALRGIGKTIRRMEESAA
jgi:AcrR family transcriptional regulator